MNNQKLLKHEALDRTYLVLSILDDHLLEHPYFNSDTKNYTKLNEAFKLLHDVYQDIGTSYE